MEPDNEIVIEGDRTGEVRQDRLWFLESMDQISRAMQGTEGLGQLSHVLETVLPIFGCDRVWLAYPCDTASRTRRMVAQHACPEFADCTSPDLDLSMDAEIAEAIRLVTVSAVAVRFGAAAGNSLPGVFAKRFGVQSQMCIWRSCSKQQASALRLYSQTYCCLVTCWKARPGLKKHNASPMWVTGIGILRQVRSSGQTRPTASLGSNRKNGPWT